MLLGIRKMRKIVIISVLMSVFLFTTPSNTYAHTTMGLDFYKLFEHHGSMMLIIDSQTGAIEHANKAAADYYGYTIEQLESMKIQEINTLTPEETGKEMQAATAEKRNYLVFKHRLADGDIRTVEVYSYPHTQGDKTILFSTVYDITAKTQLAEKNIIMTNTFLFMLSGAIIFIGIFSFLLFNNKRKLGKTNTSLKMSEENLRLLLDSAAEAIYGIDVEGNCTFCNDSCLKLLKYTHQDELLGKNMHWQIHYKRSDGTALPLEECQVFKAFIKGEGTHVEDEVFWRADGTCFPADYYSYPQYRDGKVVGAVVTFIDITERKLAQNEIIKANEQLEDANKQLREKQYSLEEQNAVIEELNSQLEDENERYQQQKEILQAIIDSLGAGIVMVDLEGKITFINDAWKDIFSYLDLSCSCNSSGNFYVNDSTCFGTELFIRNMMTGIENKDEIFSRLVDLTHDRDSRYSADVEQLSPVKRFLNLYSNPCVSYAGHAFGRVFVVRDVSHQKEVDRLKLELISTVSHELRTPMSSILGFSELLLTRKLSEERHKEYVGIINSEARRLTDLINDFLDIQRMESGKQEFKKQHNSMGQIIEEAVKIFENAGDKHKIIYDNNEKDTPHVHCDRDKMLQVLSNLLSNAVKYSPNGGEIKVDLSVRDGWTRVCVTDHGLGIPEDTKDKIFTKFYRIDNNDRRKIGGTGLGLAICKEIIRAHGGEIGVVSTYGQGSTFYFNIPLSDSMPCSADTDKESSNSSAANNGQLLIVEDDAAMVKLIKEILKDECLEMHSTSSGEEAVRFAREYDYKLFILDIALKGQLNGWDVVKELKNDSSTADTPIIISSVYENKNNPSCNDISDYLVKPFEPEQMVKVVRKALNGNLNSKMMVNSDENLREDILLTLKNKGISVKRIEHSGNMLIITLDGEEGLLNG